MLAAVAPFASRARQAMDQAVDDAKRQANNFYLNMSLGKFMESELPPLRMPDGSLAPQQKPQGGQGEEQQSMVSPVTTLIPVSESAGSSAELSVASTRANRQSVYDIPVDLVMDRVDRYSTGAVVGREGGVSGLERRLSVLELSSGGMGANTGFGAIFGSPSSQTQIRDLPSRDDLKLLLAHRLARMHGTWRIHAPEEHYSYSQQELDHPLSIVPLITAVHEVLSTMRLLSMVPDPDTNSETSTQLHLAALVRDHAVRVVAVVRSLDSENRVEWYRKALKQGLATHRTVTLGQLISGGKQKIVFEFGGAVADLFLRSAGEEEGEEEGEYEEEEYEEDEA